MKSEPQPFSWPGLSEVSSATKDNIPPADADPAQAAAEAAAAGRQQGFDRGYAEGLAKAEQEAQANREQQLARLDALVRQAEAFAMHLRANQVDLVRKIGARYLSEELLANPQRLEHLLAYGARMLPSAIDVSLACHPELADGLSQQTQFPLTLDSQLPLSRLELRQGRATLELDIDAVVSQAFAGLDLGCPENSVEEGQAEAEQPEVAQVEGS